MRTVHLKLIYMYNQKSVTSYAHFFSRSLPTFAANRVNAYHSCFRGFTLSSLAGNFKDDDLQLIVWVGVVFAKLLPNLKYMILK